VSHTPSERSAVSSALASLSGQSLTGVRYWDYSNNAPGYHWEQSGVGFDIAQYGVALQLETTSLGIAWAQGPQHMFGLQLILGNDRTSMEQTRRNLQWDDVSTSDSWRSMVGHRIESLHDWWEGTRTISALFGVECTLDDGRHFFVCLGEAPRGQLTHAEDVVAAIYESKVFHEYLQGLALDPVRVWRGPEGPY
jgi:hypothetical protein